MMVLPVTCTVVASWRSLPIEAIVSDLFVDVLQLALQLEPFPLELLQSSLLKLSLSLPVFSHCISAGLKHVNVGKHLGELPFSFSSDLFLLSEQLLLLLGPGVVEIHDFSEGDVIHIAGQLEVPREQWSFPTQFLALGKLNRNGDPLVS